MRNKLHGSAPFILTILIVASLSYLYGRMSTNTSNEQDAPSMQRMNPPSWRAFWSKDE